MQHCTLVSLVRYGLSLTATQNFCKSGDAGGTWRDGPDGSTTNTPEGEKGNFMEESRMVMEKARPA